MFAQMLFTEPYGILSYMSVLKKMLSIWLMAIFIFLVSMPLLANSNKASTATGNAGFVGAEVCGSCHTGQLKLWQLSHHDLAMQEASPKTILGDFNNKTFNYFGVISKFYREGDHFFVKTDGADGKLAVFQVKYVLGFYPLQQYLIQFTDGRIQALGLAWDSRNKHEGGQRWIHLYPKENVKAGENIHWTGIDQNWNHMCSECHTTNLHKNYDVVKNQFDTHWSEINVSCEACHGAGSKHLAWAKQPATQRSGEDGLPIHLTQALRSRWTFSNNASIAHSDNAKDTNAQMVTDLCARCHSRRSPLTEYYVNGKSLLDTHSPELLTEGKYYSDGRMQDEVYNYGSFVQSKMYSSGVTCNDCHEPHSLKLRFDNNAVCTQCHRSIVYDTKQHHGHNDNSTGAACAACHMPVSTYMVVDKRHDHGFRIPRPDLTIRYGIPNPCTDCHTKNKPEWAVKQIAKHYSSVSGGFQNFAGAFFNARRGDAKAEYELNQLAGDSSVPAIARATALWELRRYLSKDSVNSLHDGLRSTEPLVRLGSVQALSESPKQLRYLLSDVLNDPILGVRSLAAKGLADFVGKMNSPEQEVALKKATDEYISTS